MEGPRAPSEKELDKVFEFLDSQLRKDSAWPIRTEYPHAMNENNSNSMRIIRDGDKILSHALVRMLMTKSSVGIYKIAAIGSVVTADSARNQGHSQKVLESCLEYATEQGCDIAILWTNLYDFYRKIGFELAGTEYSAVFDTDYESSMEGVKIVEGTNVSPEAILKLYTSHTVGSIRTVDEVRKNLQIPNSHIYTAWDQNNQLLAYAVEGKGADLIGYIHEWGGKVPALVHLFSHIKKTQKEPLTIICPKNSQNLMRQLKASGAMINEGFLGMIKILNSKNIISKINRYSRSLGVPDLIFDHRNGTYFIGHGDQIFQTTHEPDVIRLLFGPTLASDLYEFDSQTREALEKVFPVPLWVWGWDSV